MTTLTRENSCWVVRKVSLWDMTLLYKRSFRRVVEILIVFFCPLLVPFSIKDSFVFCITEIILNFNKNRFLNFDKAHDTM